jgi:hypothetical protein
MIGGFIFNASFGRRRMGPPVMLLRLLPFGFTVCHKK